MPKYTFDAVTIDGFRGLRDLRLDDLGLVNVLVGGNNSGKTSVLEAMSLMCNPLQPLEWIEMIKRRDFGGLDENRIQSLRWCFQHGSHPPDPEGPFEGKATITASGYSPLRVMSISYREIIGEPEPPHRSVKGRRKDGEAPLNSDLRRGAEITHRVEREVAPTREELMGNRTVSFEETMTEIFWDDERNLVRREKLDSDLQVASETLTPCSYQINRYQVKAYSRGLVSKRSKDVVGLLRLFDPEIEELQIVSLQGDRPTLYIMHERLGAVPLSAFGDAVRRVVLLAATLLNVGKGGVLFLDEIETGIHSDLLGKVFAWLFDAARLQEVQLFATTHSLEALDAILGGAGTRLQELVTFHLEQTSARTDAKRIAGDLLSRLRRDRGIDVR